MSTPRREVPLTPQEREERFRQARERLAALTDRSGAQEDRFAGARARLQALAEPEISGNIPEIPDVSGDRPREPFRPSEIDQPTGAERAEMERAAIEAFRLAKVDDTSFAGELGRGLLRGVPRMIEGAGQIVQALPSIVERVDPLGELDRRPLDVRVGAREETAEEEAARDQEFRRRVGVVRRFGRQLEEAGAAGAERFPASGAVERGETPALIAAGIGEAVPQLGLQIALAYATGGSSAMTKFLAFAGPTIALEGGQAYEETLEATGDEALAAGVATSTALGSIALETIPAARFVFRSIPGARRLFGAHAAAALAGRGGLVSRIATGAGSEGLEEALQEAWGSFVQDVQAQNPDAWEGIARRMALGAVVGGIVGAGAGAVLAGEAGEDTDAGPVGRQPTEPPAAGERRQGVRRRLADVIDPSRRAEAEQQRAEMERLLVDELTGARSRDAFQRARPRLEADPETELVLLDVRNLKAMNDRVSMEAADRALRDVGGVLRDVARGAGIDERSVFRRGGDEFVVAVPRGMGQDFGEAVQVAVDDRVSFPESGFQHGVRFGVGSTFDEADARTREAKSGEEGERFRDLRPEEEPEPAPEPEEGGPPAAEESGPPDEGELRLETVAQRVDRLAAEFRAGPRGADPEASARVEQARTEIEELPEDFQVAVLDAWEARSDVRDPDVLQDVLAEAHLRLERGQPPRAADEVQPETVRRLREIAALAGGTVADQARDLVELVETARAARADVEAAAARLEAQIDPQGSRGQAAAPRRLVARYREEYSGLSDDELGERYLSLQRGQARTGTDAEESLDDAYTYYDWSTDSVRGGMRGGRAQMSAGEKARGRDAMQRGRIEAVEQLARERGVVLPDVDPFEGVTRGAVSEPNKELADRLRSMTNEELEAEVRSSLEEYYRRGPSGSANERMAMLYAEATRAEREGFDLDAFAADPIEGVREVPPEWRPRSPAGMQPLRGWWYSRMLRAIATAPQETATGRQWLGMIRSAKEGVSESELAWSKVDRFLEERASDQVGRDELLAYAREHGVVLGEVVLQDVAPGWDELVQQARDDVADYYRRLLQRTPPAGALTTNPNVLPLVALLEAREAAEHHVNTLDRATLEWSEHSQAAARFDRYIARIRGEHRQSRGPARHAEWRLKGAAEHYREILVRFPYLDPADLDLVAEWVPDPGAEHGGRWLVRTSDERHVAWVVEPQAIEAERVLQHARNQLVLGMSDWSARGGVWTTAHWPNHPNVLFHVRVDERRVGGERWLVVHELQSDLHQTGRKKGYAPPPLEPADVEVTRVVNPDDPGQWYWRAEALGQSQVFAQTLAAEHVRSLFASEFNRTRIVGEPVDQPPPAPLQRTREWVGMAFRRALQEAAYAGADRMVWISGDQAAELYDLSEHVDRITYDDYTGRLRGWFHGYTRLDRVVPREELTAYLGEDLSRQLLAAKPDERGELAVEGEELRVGGEGLRTFYDQVVRGVASREAKRLGAQVEPVAMPDPTGVSAGAVLGAVPDVGEEVTFAREVRRHVFVEGELREVVVPAGAKGSVLQVERPSRHDEPWSVSVLPHLPELDGQDVVLHWSRQATTHAALRDELGLSSAEIEAELDRPPTNLSLPITPDVRDSILNEGLPTIREHQDDAFDSPEDVHDVLRELHDLDLDPANRIRTVKGVGSTRWIDIRGQELATTQDAYAAVSPFRSKKNEILHFILLDGNDVVISHEAVTSGAIDYVNLHKDHIKRLRHRIKRTGAVRVLIVHNHPSGNARPSPRHDIPYHRQMMLRLGLDGTRVDGLVIDTDEVWVIEPPAKLGGKPKARPVKVGDTPAYDPAAPRFPSVDPDTPAALRAFAVEHFDPTRTFAVVFVDTRQRVVALEPHPLRALETIGEWLPQRLRAMGAVGSYVVGDELPGFRPADVAQALIDAQLNGLEVFDAIFKTEQGQLWNAADALPVGHWSGGHAQTPRRARRLFEGGLDRLGRPESDLRGGGVREGAGVRPPPGPYGEAEHLRGLEADQRVREARQTVEQLSAKVTEGRASAAELARFLEAEARLRFAAEGPPAPEPAELGSPGDVDLFGEPVAPQGAQGELLTSGGPQGQSAALQEARATVSRLEGRVERGGATPDEVRRYEEARAFVRRAEGRGLDAGEVRRGQEGEAPPTEPGQADLFGESIDDIIEAADGSSPHVGSPQDAPRGTRTTPPADGVVYDDTIYPRLPGRLARPEKKPRGRPVSSVDVIEKIARVTAAAGRQIPVRVGRFRGPWLGIFKVRPEVIRTRRAGDIPTAAHEMAHALEKLLYGWPKGGPWTAGIAGVDRKMQRELIAMGQALYGDRKPAGGYKREGWAEWVRAWITSDKATLELAPTLSHWFETTFLPAHPKVRDALLVARDTARRYQDQGAALRAHANMVDPASPGRRLRAAVERVRGFFTMEKLVEMGQPLYELAREAEERAGRKLLPSEDPFHLLAALRTTHDARVEQMVTRGMLDLAGNVVGQPLDDVRALVKRGEREEFLIYLWARRAMALLTDPEGPRDPGMSIQDAQQILEELGSDRFQRAAELVYAWNDGVLEYAAQASPTFREVVERVRERDPGDYVPLQRHFDELARRFGGGGGKPGVGKSSPVKRLKGSGRRIKDPFQTMIAQARQILHAAHERAVIDAMVQLAKVEGMGHIIEEVPIDRIPVAHRSIPELLDLIYKRLTQLGVDFEGVKFDEDQEGADLAALVVTIFGPKMMPGGRDPVVPIWEEGQLRWFELDGQLFDALASLEIYRLPQVAGLPLLEWTLGKSAEIFRAGTTGLRASFGLLWNPLRDPQTMYVNTRSSAAAPRLFYEWLRAMVATAFQRTTGRRTAFVDAFMRLGGEMAQVLGQDVPRTRRASRQLYQGRVARLLDPRNVFDWFRDFMQFPEGAPRIAELKLVAEQIGWEPGTPMTLDQSLELLLAAKQVTTDFTAAGELARVVNRMAPFHNASIQGPRANIRALKRNPQRFVMRGLQLTALTLLLWWQNKDEEWWRRLPYRDKWLHWWFKIRVGEREELVRIPRAFEVGLVFSALPEMLLDSWYLQDPEAAGAYAQVVVQTMAPPLLPPVLEEAGEQLANRDFFWDTPIVPMSEQRRPEEEQFNEYTSIAARALGETFGVSPRRIDHAIRGLFGPVASDVVEAVGLGGETAVGEEREGEPADLIIFGRLFQRGGVEGPDADVERLYDALEEAQKLQASIRVDETPIEVQRRLLLTDAARAISALAMVRRGEVSVGQRRALSAWIHVIAEDALAADVTQRPRFTQLRAFWEAREELLTR